ncbi:hypothetical protein Ciccas_008597 [Cichlidogyrus casuarinus]|uniref:Protein FAM91A1 n=1 Tax=Cichlidogyrus casuarinus TaxID=1844966 RepID=A0ABD2Q252_9PLAT
MDISQKIVSNIPWEELPPEDKEVFNNDLQEFEKHVILISFRFQLRFTDNLIRKVITNEKKYYQQLIAYSVNQLMVYPYHLQDKIARGLNITSFAYYRTIVKNILIAEKSYDSIPNFTAADCVRLLGIGRNQFIDLLNTYKGLQAQNGRENATNEIDKHMPTMPLDVEIKPWYQVNTGLIPVSVYELSTDIEKKCIDAIIDNQDTNKFFKADNQDSETILQDLHKRDLVFFTVPVEDDDRFDVPTLDNFVMNRVSGDQLETTMYKVFVSVDRTSSVKELADDLCITSHLVRQALSLFCRLGFATKYDKYNRKISRLSLENDRSMQKRKIAFLFDSTLTAYLMMGNLSFSLKKHAVTMFEVGRLTNESLSSFLEELNNLSNNCEGEARIYYNHAINLRRVIEFLRRKVEEYNYFGLDLIRVESLLNLDEATRTRILSKHYSLLISMGQVTYEDRQVFSNNWPLNLGPAAPELNSPWFKFYTAYLSASKLTLPTMFLPRGCKLCHLPSVLLDYTRFLVTSWGHDPAIMTATTMLYSVNELLKTGPVFLQAHDQTKLDSKMVCQFIPLPVSELLLDRIQAPQNDDLSPLLTLLRNLHQKIPVHRTCGYITLIPQQEVPEETVVEEALEIDPKDYQLETSFVMPDYSILDLSDEESFTKKPEIELQFSSLNFGVPLFDTNLCQSVLDQMTSAGNNLFEPEIQREAKASVALLLEDFQKFLKMCRAQYIDTSHLRPQVINNDPIYKTTYWPLPTRPLLISEGRIIEWI